MSANSSPTCGERSGSTPCFYWESCRRCAALEKQGRSVCRHCAERLKGIPYPLRAPSRETLYSSGRAAAQDMDMVETRRRVHRTKGT